MSSNGDSRGRLLDASGGLSIVGGILELLAGGIVLDIVGRIMIGGPLPTIPHISWMPGLEIQLVFFPGRVIIVGVLILVLGAIGIAGGISALSRKSFGLSLAGAICVLPTVLFGILAIAFVAVLRRGFGVEAKGNGVTSRSWLLVAGGILSIIGGLVQIINPGVLSVLLSYWGVYRVPFGWLITLVIVFLGFAAMIGGALALGGKAYKTSLGGAVCALPSTIFGILAIAFIVLGRRECRVEDRTSW